MRRPKPTAAPEEPGDVRAAAHQAVTEENVGLIVELDQIGNGNIALVADPQPAKPQVSDGVDGARQILPSPGNGGTYADGVEEIVDAGGNRS